jgi:pyruvate formate lyase activating enzyme
MDFGGFVPTTLIDYPGKVACLVFARGCNFHCPYCHNPGLVDLSHGGSPQIDTEALWAFLEKRKGLLDGVVVSGGEPTLQTNLVGVLKRIKRLGYRVKLDTNGSRPQMLRSLAAEGLVDFFAMDIKGDPMNYPPELAEPRISSFIDSSIDIIMQSGLDYEFRTTCVRPFIDREIVGKIAVRIAGAKRFALQAFRAVEMLNPGFFGESDPGYDRETMMEFKSISEPYVSECIVR